MKPMAGESRIQFLPLQDRQIERTAAQLIPESLALKHQLIPVRRRGKVLELAMADPADMKAMEDISVLTGLEIEPYWADGEQIQIAIRQNLTVGKAENMEEEKEKEQSGR